MLVPTATRMVSVVKHQKGPSGAKKFGDRIQND